MRQFERTALILCCIFLSGATASSQQPPQHDPQAQALVARALASTSNGVLNDVTLTGSVTRIAGSDKDTGTVTLKARVPGNSRIDFTLPHGPQLEVRGESSGSPAGSWTGPDGVAHAMSLHNCWNDATWFFPAFSLLGAISNPQIVFTYVGQETRSNSSVYHLRYARQVTTKSATSAQLISRLSTTDIYLDARSLLPVSVTYNAHPDDDASTDIPVEIRYSDYRIVNGTKVPFRIQRLLNGGQVLDLVVQTVVINSGLSDAVFTIQ